MTEIIRVPFHGTSIVANADGTQIAIRPICDSIGLAYGAQRNRLQRQPWATVSMMNTVGADGKQRGMLAVDRRTLTMWLATIETSRIKNDQARDLLIAFQREAADALDAYFNQGAAINPRADEHQINAAIRHAQMQMELCQAAKGLIHPDHLEARARIVLARGLGERPQLPADEHRILYTQDYLKAKNLSHARMRSVAGVFGKRVKQAYIDRHGCPPQKYPLNLPNGQVREVNAYTEADRDLLDAVWAESFAPQEVAA